MIEKEFKLNGNSYMLLDENEAGLLWKGTTVGESVFYEVWRKRFYKTDKILPKGNVVKAGTLIKPSNEHFGVTAWSYMTLDRAKSSLRNLGEAE